MKDYAARIKYDTCDLTDFRGRYILGFGPEDRPFAYVRFNDEQYSQDSDEYDIKTEHWTRYQDFMQVVDCLLHNRAKDKRI